MNIITAIEINKSVKEVFNYLADFNNRTTYINYLDQVILLPGPKSGVGTRYVESAVIFGRKFKTTYEVTDFRPFREIVVHSVKAPYKVESKVSLSEAKHSTLLRLSIKVKLKGIMALGSSIVEPFIEKEANRILKKIKASVEELA